MLLIFRSLSNVVSYFCPYVGACVRDACIEMSVRVCTPSHTAYSACTNSSKFSKVSASKLTKARQKHVVVLSYRHSYAESGALTCGCTGASASSHRAHKKEVATICKAGKNIRRSAANVTVGDCRLAECCPFSFRNHTQKELCKSSHSPAGL